MNNVFIHHCLRALILVLVFQCVYVSIEIVDEIRPHDSRKSLQTAASPIAAQPLNQIQTSQELLTQHLIAQDLVSGICADEHIDASHETDADGCDHCCHCHGHGSHLAVLVNDFTLPLAPEPVVTMRQTVRFTSALRKGIYRPPIA